jgi:hypothetical protein
MGTLFKSNVDADPADQYDLESYQEAQEARAQMQAPLLLDSNNPHQRLYIAMMDGTGNSLTKDAPENRSIVAKMHEQLALSKPENIASGYVEGTFTQDNPLERIPDGIAGHTFERRVETAYFDFCEQAKKWIDEDPNAQIRVAGVGFSRGAEGIAALHRMIEERGIQNPKDANVTRDRHGLIVHAEYTKQPLVPPGETIQAALLFDPVATGVKEHDRRLPGSVVSAFQITAEDERRDAFKSTNLLVPGFSEGNRFLNVTVGGSHSDIGNTYLADGLGVRSGNLGVDFLNSLSDRPFMQKRAVPEDPALSVVHRSDQHLYGLYATRGFRDGVRDRHDEIGPSVLCQRGEIRDCAGKDPANPKFDSQIEFRPTPAGPTLQQRDLQPDAPSLRSTRQSQYDGPIDRLFAAALSRDESAWKSASQAASDQYLGSPQGQTWLQEVHGQQQDQQRQEQQAALQLVAQQAQEAARQQPPVMRM